MKGSLEVLDGGFLTTIQDAGRFGYRKYGVPVSGVMDERAYELANWLVNNSKDMPVIEMTLKGGTYRFNTAAVIAITGADMQPILNDKKIRMNASVEVGEGDILSFEYCQRGCRSYLAIRGKFEIHRVLGSYSTCLTGNFGGFEGRELKKEDILSWQVSEDEFSRNEAPNDQLPYYSSKVSFRVIQGPEWNWLSDELQEKLLNTEFTISSESNRMGIRLKGQKILIKKKQMVSSPVVPGIIQLPENGQPIIIMKDGQAVGGYPRIAKVVEADLWRLGQVKTGDIVRLKSK